MKTSYLLVDRILSQLLPHGREREGRIVLPAPESCLGLLERDWLILKQNFPQENKITQTGNTELVFLEGAASTTTIQSSRYLKEAIQPNKNEEVGLGGPVSCQLVDRRFSYLKLSYLLKLTGYCHC